MEVDEVCNPSALVGFDGVAGVSKVQHKRATTEAPVFQYLVLPQVQNLRKVTTIISWLSRKKDNLVQLKKLLGGGQGYFGCTVEPRLMDNPSTILRMLHFVPNVFTCVYVQSKP